MVVNPTVIASGKRCLILLLILTGLVTLVQFLCRIEAFVPEDIVWYGFQPFTDLIRFLVVWVGNHNIAIIGYQLSFRVQM